MRNSVTTLHQQACVGPFLGKLVEVTWEDKHHNLEHLFPHPVLEILLLSTMSCGVEYPFGHSVSCVPHPVSHLPSLLAVGAECGKEKALMLRQPCWTVGEALGCYQCWFSQN